MKEETRIRLGIIEARYGKRAVRAPTEADLAADRASRFDEDFRRVREELLVPLFQEIGSVLAAAGHGHRVVVDAAGGGDSDADRGPLAAPSSIDGGKHPPSIELHLLPRDAPSGSTYLIRFFTVTGRERCEIIAEVELRGTEVELTRFQEASAITSEVAEQMVADAVEQVFAYNSAG